MHRTVRSLVAFAVAIATAGCVHPARPRAERAWTEGDVVASEQLLDSAARVGTRRAREEATSRRDEVRTERLAAVRSLIVGARIVADGPESRPVDVLAWYEAAWQLTRSGDPSFDFLREVRAELRLAQDARLAAYHAARLTASTWALHCDTRTPNAALDELVMLAEAAGQPPPVAFFLGLSRRCFEAGRYIRAGLLADRAQVLETAAHHPPPDPEVLVRLALGHRRTGRMHRLTATARRHVEERAAPEVATATAAAPPAAPAQPRPVRPPPTDTAAVAEGDSRRADGAEVVQSVLGRVRSLHARGDVHGALVRLDEAISDLKTHPHRGRLVQQRTAWREDRAVLIRHYLDEAEAALAAQRPDEAAILYDRILELEPDHAVAVDRLRRIDNLRSLRDHRGD